VHVILHTTFIKNAVNTDRRTL